mmetsp:Transcript_7296/g.10442  ORF Transcript_7296/g.10442 Transcript_7296/m.10442 type:complete len:244 (-) Transcript_7296:1567-2298(-)
MNLLTASVLVLVSGPPSNINLEAVFCIVVGGPLFSSSKQNRDAAVLALFVFDGFFCSSCCTLSFSFSCFSFSFFSSFVSSFGSTDMDFVCDSISSSMIDSSAIGFSFTPFPFSFFGDLSKERSLSSIPSGIVSGISKPSSEKYDSSECSSPFSCSSSSSSLSSSSLSSSSLSFDSSDCSFPTVFRFSERTSLVFFETATRAFLPSTSESNELLSPKPLIGSVWTCASTISFASPPSITFLGSV